MNRPPQFQASDVGDVEAWIGDRWVEVGHAWQRCVFAGSAAPGRQVLGNYLSRLRLSPEGIGIECRPNGYVLLAEPDVVDVQRFRPLIDRTRAADDEHALGLFDQAVAPWRGEPFAGLETPWLVAVRTGLEREWSPPGSTVST